MESLLVTWRSRQWFGGEPFHCQVIAVGAVDHSALHAHCLDAILRHPNASSKVAHNFDLLGAAIGEDEFVHHYTGAGRQRG